MGWSAECCSGVEFNCWRIESVAANAILLGSFWDDQKMRDQHFARFQFACGIMR
jgi:hypothetical protein